VNWGVELHGSSSVATVAVEPKAIREAEFPISGCEHYRRHEAAHLRDSILAGVKGKHGALEFVWLKRHQAPVAFKTIVRSL
jgi:hypothetical protein